MLFAQKTGYGLMKEMSSNRKINTRLPACNGVHKAAAVTEVL